MPNTILQNSFTKVLLGIFSVSLLIGIFFYTADPVSSQSITCSDGTNCGQITSYNVSAALGELSTSKCELYGKGNYGGQYCDQNGNYGNIYNQASGSWLVQGYTTGRVPTSAQLNNDPNWNIGIFNNVPVQLHISATNGGTATVGNTTASNMGCTCGIDDVNPNPSNSSCINASATATGTANPGDPINIQIVAKCKPDSNSSSSCTGTSCGRWAAGYADVYLPTVTKCMSSSHPSNTTHKNYMPTAQGVCTAPGQVISFTCSSGTLSWNTTGYSNLSIKNSGNNTTISAAPTSATGNITNIANGTYTINDGSTILTSQTCNYTPPAPGLTAQYTNGNSVTLSSGQTSIVIPFTFWNSGAVGSTVHVDTSDCKLSGITAPLSSSNVIVSRCDPGDYTK